MANVNAQLASATIQVLDITTLTYRVNSPVGTLTLAATAATYDSFVTIVNGAGTALDLPATNVFVVYVKNLDAAATLTVIFQAQGGALLSAANSPVLLPNGVFMYWNTVETSNGISAVTLVSSAATSAAEILLAA
jgi:hypothetical protein